MGRRVFVDTNVFVYLHDTSEPTKRAVARAIMLNDDLDLVISSQVLSEFFVTVTRKIPEPLTFADATTLVEGLAELEVLPLTRNLVVDATRTAADNQLSYWDALIVEAASRGGAEELLTEDLSAGATISGVRVVNPFAG